MADNQPEAALILSSVARQHVASTSSNAIFFVRARAADDAHPDVQGRLALERLMDHEDDDDSSNSSESEPLDDKWIPLDIRTATGFAVRRYAGITLILTVAHIVRPVYAHKPVITDECAELNTAFRFEIMCVHQERDLLTRAPLNADIGAMKRGYTSASVLAIDSQLDLLALRVVDHEIANFNQNIRRYVPCMQPHSLIPIAQMPPNDSEEVLLQAWPELRNDSTFWAISSYPQRRYNCLTSSNPYLYGMKLLELPGVSCMDGSSGGPVVNAHLEAVAVYHATLGNCGFAIPSSAVLTFLNRYHLLEGPIPPAPV